MSELTQKDLKHVWHPFTQHLNAAEPLEILKAKGSLLFDSEGKSYIDANSSWWVNTHGHAHPKIAEAISKQFNELDHTVFAGVTHPKAVELAERIAKRMPDELDKIFFSDNGSTSVEVAIKMVIQYWHNKRQDKKRFMALSGSYHGDTFGSMSVSQRGYFNEPFEPYFFEVDYIEFPNEHNQLAILAQVEKMLASGDFAGLIIEPLVQGAAGMRMYSATFLDQLVELAHKYNVLVVFDEVMTGFGRTGRLFAMDHCEHKPDIVALSKGLTAGIMAMGITVASNKIFDAFLSDEMAKALLHGHSFTANPIACAVACASLDIFETDETWEGIRNIESWHQEFAKELAQMDNVEGIRQCGTILAFEIVQDNENGYFSNVRAQAYEHLLAQGVLLRPLGNTLFINPPYCLTKEEYAQIREGIISFVDA